MTSMPSASDSPQSHDDWRKKELGMAASNAIKLGSSLLVTWGIGLVARLYIPRFLGPDRFGTLNFAEAFTATSFVFLDLGMGMYVRKEISVHPERADEFIGGIVAVRILLTLLVFIGMEIVLRATHCRVEVRNIVYIYGFTQFFMIGNATSGGLLQAIGRVSGMSVLSVVVKLLWAGFLVAAIVLHLGLWAFASTYALTEGIKSLVLFRLARKHLKFGVKIRTKATIAVIIAALPFFVSGIATTVNDKIGASLLAFLASEREVGWLGAANGLVGLTMLLAPLFGWVVIPLFARAAAKSKEELYGIVRRTLEYVLSLSILASMVIMLGADQWVAIVFGQAYAPAVLAVRVLAVTTVLMYVSIVAFNALAVLDYTWHMSVVAVGGMLVTTVSNLLLVPFLSRRLGPGGGAAASAIATFLTEVGIVASLFGLLGRRGYDRRLVTTTSKNLMCAVLVTAFHFMVPLAIGPLRIVVDVLLYTVVVLAIGGIDARQIVRLARMRSSLRSANG